MSFYATPNTFAYFETFCLQYEETVVHLQYVSSLTIRNINRLLKVTKILVQDLKDQDLTISIWWVLATLVSCKWSAEHRNRAGWAFSLRNRFWARYFSSIQFTAKTVLYHLTIIVLSEEANQRWHSWRNWHSAGPSWGDLNLSKSTEVHGFQRVCFGLHK